MTKTCSVHASVIHTTPAQETESVPLTQDPQAQERIFERYSEKYVDVPVPLFQEAREELCEMIEALSQCPLCEQIRDDVELLFENYDEVISRDDEELLQKNMMKSSVESSPSAVST